MPPTPVGDRCRVGEEQQVAAGHEGVGQAGGAEADLGCLRQCGVRQLAEFAHRHGVVLAQPLAPRGKRGAQAGQHGGPLGELHRVALTVVEPDRLDVRKAVERPGQAGGGVLPTGEEDERAIVHRWRV